jgi:superfamily II DNA or RNA helicase
MALASRPTRLTPRDHQTEAIAAVDSALSGGGRATIVLACGTGKTLIEHRVAARHARVLVLEPSIALIQQSLEAARVDGLSEGRELLLICSDATVRAHDAWELTEEDLGARITLDPDEIRSRLQAPRVLVFCTYQSAQLLSDSLPKGFRFDFAVFDEAHRTAGSRDKKWSATLLDSELPSDRRMFATATPRHTTLSDSNDSDVRVVYSMSDEDLYGPVVYRLGLTEAIDRKIISDYEVLISCVTDAEVRTALRHRQDLMVRPSGAPLDEVAQQLTIVQAMARTGAKKAISFHRTISDAEDFAADRGAVFRDASVRAFHINGGMRSAERSRVLSRFLASQRPAVLTNARCLTEGVDLPAVDMVCFCMRKESPVDVTQAVGRALRAYPGKDKGYIVLPVFVDADGREELDTAVDRAELSVTWSLLHQILEADELAVEKTAASARKFGYSGERPRKLAKVRVVAPDGIAEKLSAAITVRAVEKLLPRWNLCVGALESFRAREGHLTLPAGHVENGIRLHRWLTHVRVLKRRGKLSAERIRQLDSLGVSWSPNAEAFEEMLESYSSHRAIHGHATIPRTEANKRLLNFVTAMRVMFKEGTLSQSRLDRLKEVGFRWHAIADTWDRYRPEWDALVRSGRTTIPRTREHMALRYYVSHLQRSHAKGGLPDYLVEELLKARVPLVPSGASGRHSKTARDTQHAVSAARVNWDHAVQAVAQALGSRGAFGGITSSDTVDGVPLTQWMTAQRAAHRRGSLAQERIAQLDRLGFPWSVTPDRIWSDALAMVEVYRTTYGHQVDPPNRLYGRGSLRAWIVEQQAARESGLMAEERVAALDAIDFRWTRDDELWELYLRVLDAPDTHQAWLTDQRVKAFRARVERLADSEKLRQDRVAELVRRGIDPSRRARHDDDFERMLTRYGEARETQRRDDAAGSAFDGELAKWIRGVRRARARGVLPAERIAHLDAAGFRWDTQSEGWERHRHLWERFKATGMARVPYDKTWHVLYRYLAAVRTLHRNGRLPPHLVDEMQAAGVDLEVPPSSRTPRTRARSRHRVSWERVYGGLVDAVDAHGRVSQIPGNHEVDGVALRTWMHYQRRAARLGTLSEARVKALDAIGFPWDAKGAPWSAGYRAMSEFRRLHGHQLDPPDTACEALQLGHWIFRQRALYEQDALPNDRIEALNAIGFKWTRDEEVYEWLELKLADGAALSTLVEDGRVAKFAARLSRETGIALVDADALRQAWAARASTPRR